MSKNVTSILITALGVEGGGTLMNWILDCARNYGLHVQGTSVPGVAQRTGSTSYYIEICDQKFKKSKEPILSLYPKPGRVDVVIASEILEAARTIDRGYVNPDRTILISSSNRTYTNIEKIHTSDGRFDLNKIINTCDKMSKKFIQLDMNKIAIDNSTIVSAPMFGALFASNILPWSKENCEQVFKNDIFGINSLAGFNSAIKEIDLKTESDKKENNLYNTDYLLNIKNSLQKDLPDNLLKTLILGHSRCLDYQNILYANLYIERINSLLPKINIEKSRDIILLDNIIKRLALWMAYEDIPRVAELKIKPERYSKIKKEVRLEKDQILIIQDIFKPGKNEIAAMLPYRIGSWLTKRNKLFFIPFVGRGMKINSQSISGFLVLKTLSMFKYIRKFSYRYKEEQDKIDQWLSNIKSSLKFSIGYAEGIADMPQILKGYGDTWERGKLKYSKINSKLIENKNFEKLNENDEKILKKAILISLNQLEVKELDNLLEKI